MDRQTDVDGLSLIDVSAEDDSLLSSPAIKLHNDADRTLDFHSSPATTVRVQQSALASTQHRISPSESTEAGRANEKHSVLHDGLNCGADKQNSGSSLAMEGEQPQLCIDAVQPKKKRRAGQCNLRKSLAWDKAFFTSEGVLNPEELSLVNKTFKKSNETVLPVIEEEESVRSSFGSNCSLGEEDPALQCLEEKLFTEHQTSKPKFDNEVDKICSAASCETFPAQPLGHPPSNVKHLATEKRHIAMKVLETPLQKKAPLGPQVPFTSKRSSAKATDELHKASQSNDAYGKNCSAAPPVVTKNLSKGHKRMKYTHGNAVPAILTRASYHRNSPAKIKENFGITSRYAPSPNSSASDNFSSEKCPASSSCTLEKLRKSLFEMPKEGAPGTKDSDRNGNLFGTSSLQFCHGMPAFHSSMVSATSTGSSSLFPTHTFREQFAPTTGVGTSADSTVSQCGKNQEFWNTMADSTSIAGNSAIFSAKNPPSNSGHALPVTFTAKPSALRLPRKDDPISIASNSMVFSAKDPPSNSSNALPVTFAPKPSGLRMPSPKLGFFDSTKVIRAPYSSALHRRSAGNRALPPRAIPRGPSSILQGNRLKPPGVPRAIPSSISVSNFSFPNYNAIVPPSTPVTSNLLFNAASKNSITSIPAPPFQPQVKPESEVSGLVLLAQKKFGVSKAQQISSVQRSDQTEVPSDVCNSAKAIIAEDIERKTILLSNCCRINQNNHGNMADENLTQLGFSHGKSSLEDIPQVGSEEITAATIDIETSPITEAGKICKMNVVSDILDNLCIPKGSYGKTAEESMTQLSFMQGKSTSQDICQRGPEAILKERNGTDTSPTVEIGKASNASNTYIPQPGHSRGMAVLSDARTNDLMKPLQSEQLSPLMCSKITKISEKFKLETCPDLSRNNEYNGLSNSNSEGTMRDDKAENGISDLGSSLQQENKMKLASWPLKLEHLPTLRRNSGLCSGLQENEMEPVSWPVRSDYLPSLGQKEIGKVSIGLDIASTTGSVSVHIEKQDAASCQVSRASISTQNEDLHDNVRIGNSNLVCQLQLENEMGPASQPVKIDQSLPTRKGETEKVTEESLFSEASSHEKGLDVVQNEANDRSCTKVCQGSMNKQKDYSYDKVKSLLSDVTGSLEFKTGIVFNLNQNRFHANASNFSNNNQNNTTDTLITPLQLSGCPSYEASPSVTEHKSEEKDDSSFLNMKLSDSSVTLKVQTKSGLKVAGNEVKFSGRSPLAANYRLLNSTDQEISQKHVKEQMCSMVDTERLTSLPRSFPVLDDTAEKENSRPEVQDGVDMLQMQGVDGDSHVYSGRKSMGNLSVQVQKIKNPLDASPFSEEWIAAIQAVGEEWLQMKRGPVQNSPPNKMVPQPGPWSPVRRPNQQLGPFDCTKYSNAPGSSDVYEDE